MKKIFAFALCFALCLAFVGCRNEETKNKEQNATINTKEVLEKVLNQEQNFIIKSLVFDNVSEENLNNFSFSTEANAKNAFIPQGYTYVDLDSDAIEEMVIFSVAQDYFLILRYANEKAYGYIVPQRSLIDLKTDGSFMTSSGAGINTISTMSFVDTSFEIENKAYQDDMNREYLLDGKASNKETVEEYFENWRESTSKVSWESSPTTDSETLATEPSVAEPTDTEEETVDDEEPVATKPKLQNESPHDELVKIVAKSLDIPEDLAYTYKIGDLFYWDAGEIWLRSVSFRTEDDGQAMASVDPTDGRLIKSILNYEKPE